MVFALPDKHKEFFTVFKDLHTMNDTKALAGEDGR